MKKIILVFGILLGFFFNVSIAQQVKQVTFKGTVIDSVGSSINGAKVTVYEMWSDGIAGNMYFNRADEIITDQDGAFTFSTEPKPERGTFIWSYIVATKKDLALGSARWEMQQDMEQDIMLGKPEKLEGVIVDEAGEPIAGADVRANLTRTVKSPDGQEETQWLPGIPPFDELITQTNNNGEFLISGLPADSSVDLLIKAAGKATIYSYQSETSEPAFVAGQTDIKVVLPDEARIEGKIVDPDTGEGIPGLEFAVVYTASGLFFYRFVCETDNSGDFSIGGLLSSEYLIRGGTPLESVYVQAVSGQTKTITTKTKKLYYGRVIFEDGSSVVIEPEPWPGAKTRITVVKEDGRGEQMIENIDEEGYFVLYLSESQYQEFQSGTSWFQIRYPLPESNHFMGEEFFAYDLLSTDRTKVGLAKIPKLEQEPELLVGKPLPELEELGFESLPDISGKMTLICFWDSEQRPSRNLVNELAERQKELEDKGLLVLLVHSTQITDEKLREWTQENNIPFISGRIIEDSERVLFRWGVRAQPWLVLADENAEILAGGFNLNQLDETLEKIDSAESTEEQLGQISDKILLRLIDTNGLSVSGAKVGTNVRTIDSPILNSNLNWSLSGSQSNISSNWGEITLSREQLFPSGWAEERKSGIFILHEERKIGAVCDISKDDERNVIELTLIPVCHVYGKLDSDGLKNVNRPLTWTNVYMGWSQDSWGILSHSSDEQRFEFFVPPGEYEMMAYGSGRDGSDPARTSASTENKNLTIEVKQNQRELDLGTIDLLPTKIATLIGKPAPEIGPIQAWKNGSPVTLSELKDKVVIIYFDGDSPNTSRDFPPLVELYEQFHDHGLEIIALYNCESMEQLEKNWIDIYETYGGEPEVPFHVAVDGGESGFYEGTDKIRLGATYNTYDITMDPTTILIDMQGNIIGKLNLGYAKETVQEMLGVVIEPEFAGWRQRFNEVYFLEEGQILKRIAPPFIPERMDYYREEESFQYSNIERPPDFFTFHWDGRLGRWGYGFGRGRRPLRSVLNSNLSMNQNSYEGLDELLEVDVPGDWIVLKDASEEQKLEALEEILEKELGRKIRFERRQVEQEAIVAIGSFEYHRLPVANEDRYILMFSDDFDEDYGTGGGTADSVHEFLEAVGNRVNMPVIDETEPPGEVIIPYEHYSSADLSRVEDPLEKAQKLTELLDNITQQTNLRFTIEPREIEKWFIFEENEQ